MNEESLKNELIVSGKSIKVRVKSIGREGKLYYDYQKDNFKIDFGSSVLLALDGSLISFDRLEFLE